MYDQPIMGMVIHTLRLAIPILVPYVWDLFMRSIVHLNSMRDTIYIHIYIYAYMPHVVVYIQTVVF